jgi:hypothetical protein
MEIDDSGWSRIEEARNSISPPTHFFPNLKTPPTPPVQIPAVITDPRGPSWSRNDPRGDPERTPGQARDGPVTSPCCLTGPSPCRVFADNSSNAIVGEVEASSVCQITGCIDRPPPLAQSEDCIAPRRKSQVC